MASAARDAAKQQSTTKATEEPSEWNSRFLQQDLPSFYATYNLKSVIPVLIGVFVVTLPLGVSVLATGALVQEVELRYDDISRCTYSTWGSVVSLSFNGTTVRQGCRTRRIFTVASTIPAPSYIYYRVTGMFQNYRLYQDSRDDVQSRATSPVTPASTCVPFQYPGQVGNTLGNVVLVNNVSRSLGSIPYNPCGSLAWSLFNDTLSLYKLSGSETNVSSPTILDGSTAICIGGPFAGSSANHSCTKSGIALSVDVDTRFVGSTSVGEWGQPTGVYNESTTDPFLFGGYYYNEPGHRVPAIRDEDYMVWTRVGAFPDFRKLYRIVNVDIPAGRYMLDVVELYDTVSFGGEKYFVLSTVSYVGAKNTVLGAALVFVAGVALIIAAVFLCLHEK